MQVKQKPSLKLAGIFWLGSCIAVLSLFILEKTLAHYGLDSTIIIGSFGATAVLVFAAPQSPFSKARNVIFGHILSAIIGVTFFILLGEYTFIAASLAVSTAIAAMYLSSTIHPPGGATAFIAVMGGTQIHELGYLYVLIPCALGAILLYLLAYIFHYYFRFLEGK